MHLQGAGRRKSYLLVFDAHLGPDLGQMRWSETCAWGTPEQQHRGVSSVRELHIYSFG